MDSFKYEPGKGLSMHAKDPKTEETIEESENEIDGQYEKGDSANAEG
jgi:hypothetical protein